MTWGNSIFPLLIIEASGGYSGLFVYSPAPGANTLIASVAATNGTDPWGNAYLSGYTTYVDFSGTYYALQLAGGGLQWYIGAVGSEAGPYVQTSSVEIGNLTPGSAVGAFIEMRQAFGLVANAGLPVYEVWLSPSGDTTGASDTALLTACFGNNVNIVHLAGGTWYLDATVTLGLGQYLYGAGMAATVVKLVSAAGAVPAFKLINTGSYSTEQFAGLYNLKVDITGAAAGANAVQAGDILQLQVHNVSVQATSTQTAAAAYFVNNLYQTEQAMVRMYFAGCTTPVQFDVQGTGSNSFDRGDFTFSIDQFNANGNGISWTNGALQIGGSLKVRGNFSGAATNTGKVFAFSGAGASLQRLNFDVSVEADGSGTGPQTINFGVGSNTIDGYGAVDFLNSGATFQASNNNGQYSVVGEPAHGDVSLQTLIGAGSYTFISTGFPAGWSGRVGFQKMPTQDQVFLLLELSIAATTVVTAGETILAAATIVSPYLPQGTLTGWVACVQEVNGNWTTVPVQVTTGGALLYRGTGFTAAGTSALEGSGVYSNSQ